MSSTARATSCIIAEDNLVHRDKDMSRFAAEMQAEGEDEIIYIDEDEIEDLDDFEYDEEDTDD